MPKWTRIAVAAFVVVAAGLIAWRWFVEDHAEPVPTAEVVDRFRESTSSDGAGTTDVTSSDDTQRTPEATVPTSSDAVTESTVVERTTDAVDTTTSLVDTGVVPLVLGAAEPGVYRYTSTGWEEIDALGGAHHDYPDETTITVTESGCGVRLRWDALRERRDEWALCVVDDGIELQPDGVQYHEFFSQPDEEAVVCDEGAILVPRDPESAPRTEQKCRLADDPWFPVWEVLDRTARTVDGISVDVTHVRMTVLDEDEHWERTTIDWYLTDEGLPVEVTGVKESNTPSPVGDVEYHEEYELSLISLTPIR